MLAKNDLSINSHPFPLHGTITYVYVVVVFIVVNFTLFCFVVVCLFVVVVVVVVLPRRRTCVM